MQTKTFLGFRAQSLARRGVRSRVWGLGFGEGLKGKGSGIEKRS